MWTGADWSAGSEKIDRLLERAAKGKLKAHVVVL
jgi:hypothetical protein